MLMSDPHDLSALIAALGEAAVGSRELDERIALYVGWAVQPDGQAQAGIPAYSTSLDAALTLVPVAETVRVWLTIGAPGAWASIDPIRVHQAATPALAMCCAALRSRSAGGWWMTAK